MKVAIYSRILEAEIKAQLILLIAELRKHNIEILLHHSIIGNGFEAHVKGISIFTGQEQLDDTTDFLISLGGDGTMLDTARRLAQYSTPLIGINHGLRQPA